MKWINDILEKHVNDEGVLDREAADAELKNEAPKHVIPKNVYNDKVDELNTANTTINELKKEHGDVDTLQEKISDYETEIEKLKDEKKDQALEFSLREALSSSGAEDVDYFVDKLKGDITLNDKGELEGYDDLVKEYQTKHPKLFTKADNDDKKNDNGGFSVIDNDLDKGNKGQWTKEKIMAIEDDDERQSKIKENLKLFR